MSIKRNKCVICNSNILKKIYDLNNVPINLTCCNEIIKYKYETLSFSQCKKCNTIQLNSLIPLDILYEKSHNYNSFGKIWEEYFKILINKINKSIINKNVLEIGCPSGKIALNCEKYDKWFIVDPNKNNSIKFNYKIKFYESFFDEKFTINNKINVIIHSHLFEHIYEPNIFLQKCYEILDDDGEMIFGIPNMTEIANNDLCLFLGIFFEHTIFMHKENVTFLLQKNGFEIKEIIDYSKHSTIYHVKKNMLFKNNINEIKIPDYFDKFMECLEKYDLFIKKCNLIISNTNKLVYIFSASYNTQFLLTMGIQIKYLTGILDNSRDKQNKYFYGFNLLIYDPQVIINNDCIVIIKNSFYTNEITEQLLLLNPNTQILT